jgi:DNA modification methylase
MCGRILRGEDYAVKIKELKFDPRNANKGTERGRKALASSLRQFGAGRSILIDKNGMVIAGNKTLAQAIAAGHEEVKVVKTDGTEIVAVQRIDLDLRDSKAKGLAVADNRVGELDLEWDTDVISEIVKDVDLGDFWEPDEFNKLIGAEPEAAPEPKLDQAAALQKKWGTELGQLWVIGKHRLLCGDATKECDVVALMAGKQAQVVYTDPPYGVDYDGGMKKREKLSGDHTGTTIYTESLRHLLIAADDAASLYLWYADAHAAAAAAAAAGYEIVAQIIWAKNHAQFMSTAHYHGKHEPCFFAHRKGKTARWYGPKNEVTLWEYDRSASNDFHPTQKPVALAVRALNNSSQAGDIVLDLFLDSGATMCAAEETRRTCYALEIEPKYVAVALERMADMGLKPELAG